MCVLREVIRMVDCKFYNCYIMYTMRTSTLLLKAKFNHIFASPEAILNTTWRSLLLMSDFVSRIIVDEAHCIAKWGYEFHRAYSQIVQLCLFLPAGTPVLALTAIASKSTEKVIADSLHLHSDYSIIWRIKS